MEIDAWDGPAGGEPVVTHGHTVCTKAPFRDVIRSLVAHATAMGLRGLIRRR